MVYHKNFDAVKEKRNCRDCTHYETSLNYEPCKSC